MHTGEHVSLLMLEKKGCSRDHLLRERKEQLVSSTKRNNKLYSNDNEFNFFSLGGWSIRVEPMAAQLLGRLFAGGLGKLESQETTQFLCCIFSLWSSGKFEGCSCWHSQPWTPICHKSYVLQGWPTSTPTCCAVREHDCTSHPETREEKTLKNKSWPCWT